MFLSAEHGLPGHCEISNSNYGPEGGLLKEKGGALFGYTDLYGGYPGGQAEYVRVPFANFGPRKISDRYTRRTGPVFDRHLPHRLWCESIGPDVKPGDTVEVFGCGPVGLMALEMRLGARGGAGIRIG